MTRHPSESWDLSPHPRHPSESSDLRPHPCHPSESWDLPPIECYATTMARAWTYIMTSRPHGVLYIGVTTDLPARVLQHREGRGSNFCRRYNSTRLVLAEEHHRIEEAIAREKAMKAWKRAWKVGLIELGNPQWNDLWESINA